MIKGKLEVGTVITQEGAKTQPDILIVAICGEAIAVKFIQPDPDTYAPLNWYHDEDLRKIEGLIIKLMEGKVNNGNQDK